jgi:hypothetical protein
MDVTVWVAPRNTTKSRPHFLDSNSLPSEKSLLRYRHVNLLGKNTARQNGWF